jgi:hypothetical protein
LAFLSYDYPSGLISCKTSLRPAAPCPAIPISGYNVAYERINGKILSRYGVNSYFIIKHILYHADNRYDLYGSFLSILDC